MLIKKYNQGRTVHLTSNDHPEMGSLISQLLDFKTSRFNIALSPLGIQGLNAALVQLIPTMDFVLCIVCNPQ